MNLYNSKMVMFNARFLLCTNLFLVNDHMRFWNHNHYSISLNMDKNEQEAAISECNFFFFGTATEAIS